MISIQVVDDFDNPKKAFFVLTFILHKLFCLFTVTNYSCILYFVYHTSHLSFHLLINTLNNKHLINRNIHFDEIRTTYSIDTRAATDRTTDWIGKNDLRVRLARSERDRLARVLSVVWLALIGHMWSYLRSKVHYHIDICKYFPATSRTQTGRFIYYEVIRFVAENRN